MSFGNRLSGLEGELGEPAAGGEEFGRGALLNNLPVVKDRDIVGFLDHGIAVSDDQRGGTGIDV